jgi:predicted DNA-binding transcriptional regulator YafY
MRDSSAVVAMYTDAKGELAARCLWPNSISLSKENQITARCYCTLRREWRSFRLDRVIACHELTTPDDILADDEPNGDFEDSHAGRNFRALA